MEKKLCKKCGSEMKPKRIIPYANIPYKRQVDVNPWDDTLVFHGDPSISVFPGFIGTEVETCGEALRGEEYEEEVDCYCDSPCCRGYYMELVEGEGITDEHGLGSMFVHSFEDYKSDLWMFVSDSSIWGVEAVSHPMTYEFMRQRLYKGWYHLERYLTYHQINDPLEGSSNNAGMHVHLSKDAFIDDKHVKRFAQLCEMFYDKIVFNIGLRKTTQYTRSSGILPIQDEDDFLQKWYDGGKNYEKFQIVNTSKCHTVEVRAYRAPQTRERYFAYVQLCIVLFTMAKRKKILGIRWSDVRDQAENMNFVELINIWK